MICTRNINKYLMSALRYKAKHVACQKNMLRRDLINIRPNRIGSTLHKKILNKNSILI